MAKMAHTHKPTTTRAVWTILPLLSGFITQQLNAKGTAHTKAPASSRFQPMVPYRFVGIGTPLLLFLRVSMNCHHKMIFYLFLVGVSFKTTARTTVRKPSSAIASFEEGTCQVLLQVVWLLLPSVPPSLE